MLHNITISENIFFLLQPVTKPDDSTQAMKELTGDTSTDTKNRRAIDNVYSSITITKETQFSTPI